MPRRSSSSRTISTPTSLRRSTRPFLPPKRAASPSASNGITPPSTEAGSTWPNPNYRSSPASAFTPHVQPIASRRWSRSGRGCFGAIAPGVARGLKLRHDHGSNYMSGDFQDEIKCLGIEASPSFVREPEGNGVAERFIRTLKENLLWVRTFKTIEELRAELVAFARRYNETWLVARHGYKTPASVREEQTMPPIAIDPTLAAALPVAARASAAGCLKTVPHYKMIHPASDCFVRNCNSALREQ